MKKIISLFLGAILLFNNMNAQVNNLKVHPLHLLRSKFEFERKLSDNVSVGAIGSVFFLYSGYRIEPYCRLYFMPANTKAAFTGTYLQIKGHYSKAIDKQTPENEVISEYGFSAALGYQIQFKNNITMDFFSGYRSSHTLYPSTTEASSMFSLLNNSGRYRIRGRSVR